jgi:glycosyltransferase involved in cell wall biosynthesis
MKIGLLVYGSLDTVSGGYLYDRRLVAGLREARDEVHILSLPWRGYAAGLADNLRMRVSILPQGLDLLIQDELVHPSLLAANRGRHSCPIVSLVHHLRCSESHPAWLNGFYRLVERSYLRSVDGFVFNSQTTREAVQALAGEGKPSLVAYPPTDRFGAAWDDESAAEAAIRARSREAGLVRVLFLGNLIPRKGLHVLIAALARLPGDSVVLDAVGSLAFDPAYARRVQRQAGALGLGARVRFHGSLDEEALRERLRAAHVLAVPSFYEGYGIAYLEGMGFGLPAIGTTAGAAGEIVTSGLDGYLIRPGDAQALAQALGWLAEDRDILERMSLAAWRRYRAQPSWETTCRELRSFLFEMT